LGPQFSSLELDDAGNDKLINDLVTFLELRMNRKNLLLKNWQQKREYFVIVVMFSCFPINDYEKVDVLSLLVKQPLAK
jgi:hypothetical protein